MRVLLLHADKFRYRAIKKAIKKAEPLDNSNKEEHFENVLVVFTTVEPNDEKVVDEAVNDIFNHLKRIGINKVVLYPYAHLSSNLAKPWEAIRVLQLLENKLREKGVEVTRAPFGWYKSFELSCKGHPLAELSRTYKPVPKKLNVKKVIIMSSDGSEYEDTDDLELKKVLEALRTNSWECEGEDLACMYCKKFGVKGIKIGTICTQSYGPLAYFIYNTVIVYASYLVNSLEIPIFSIKGPTISNECKINGIRCDNFCLRDSEMDQVEELLTEGIDVLPIGIFEVATLYRNEHGNVCKRCSSFTVPTLTLLLKGTNDLFNYSLMLHDVIHSEAEKVGRKYVVMYTVNEDFYKNNKDLLLKMVKRDNRDAIVRIVSDDDTLMDAEYFIITNCGKPLEVGSWSLYASKEHDGIYAIKSAPIGSIERFIYMIFDKAALDFKNDVTPSLPSWLSPIQVRIIPVNRDVLAYALSVADELKGYGVRVDVDDRNIGLGKKVRDAGKEWIPYIITVGEREKDSNTVIVTKRVTNDKVEMSIEELVNLIKEDIGNYPQLPQTLPILYSKRPSFAKPLL